MNRTQSSIRPVALVCLLIFTLSTPGVADDSSGARDCATCHLSWTEAFGRKEAVVLVERDAVGQVSDERTCLGCHDGSVGDSRRRVWVDHGHRNGVTPPPEMQVAANLPLSEGTVNCLTCHSAHAGSGEETIATIVFLRMPNERGELCQACHASSLSAPAHVNHPMGEVAAMPVNPRTGARPKAQSDDQWVTCMSCHTPHGSSADGLLRFDGRTESLCVQCHADANPVEQTVGQVGHRVNLELDPASHGGAIALLGDHLGKNHHGENRTLTCLSCHQMHDAKPDQQLLNGWQGDANLCLQCHTEYQNLSGSSHDLRETAPERLNDRGVTAVDGGVCSACHGFHRQAFTPRATQLDTLGLCASCHAPGECGEAKLGDSFMHPTVVNDPSRVSEALRQQLISEPGSDAATITCLTCHNPHEVSHQQFLREPADQLCAGCHQSQSTVLVGAHDMTAQPDARNAHGHTVTESGKCGFCHDVHRGADPVLWSATSQPVQKADDLCLQCHRADGLAGTSIAHALKHPQGPFTASTTESLHLDLPMFDADGGRQQAGHSGFVSCASCHNPHADSTSNQAMLRTVREDEATVASHLCLACHHNTDHIDSTGHSTKMLSEFAALNALQSERTACGPCHAVHNASGDANTTMWNVAMANVGSTEEERRCLGCHANGQGITQVEPIKHAVVTIQDQTLLEGETALPLVVQTQNGQTHGRFGCTTCHVPHGRDIHEGDEEAESPQAHRAFKCMLRPYVAPNLCSSCHGAEGLQRYLYFHKRDRLAE